MQAGVYGWPVPRQIWVFEGGAYPTGKSQDALFVAPVSGTYLISACAGGSSSLVAGGQIFRMPVYLQAGEHVPLTIGYGGWNGFSNGGSTVVGDFVTLDGTGGMTQGSRMCSPVNLASGGGPGFSADLSTWPSVGAGIPGSASNYNGRGYGVGGYNVYAGAPGLVVIEQMP